MRRVAQRGNEQVHLQRLFGHWHTHGAEVDLQLIPGWSLVADRRDALRHDFASQVCHCALDGAQTDMDAVFAHKLLAHDIAVAAVLAELDREPLGMRAQATGSLW